MQVSRRHKGGGGSAAKRASGEKCARNPRTEWGARNHPGAVMRDQEWVGGDRSRGDQGEKMAVAGLKRGFLYGRRCRTSYGQSRKLSGLPYFCRLHPIGYERVVGLRGVARSGEEWRGVLFINNSLTMGCGLQGDLAADGRARCQFGGHRPPLQVWMSCVSVGSALENRREFVIPIGAAGGSLNGSMKQEPSGAGPTNNESQS